MNSLTSTSARSRLISRSQIEQNIREYQTKLDDAFQIFNVGTSINSRPTALILHFRSVRCSILKIISPAPPYYRRQISHATRKPYAPSQLSNRPRLDSTYLIEEITQPFSRVFVISTRTMQHKSLCCRLDWMLPTGSLTKSSFQSRTTPHN
jgi:hypothetical protein